MRHHGQAVFDNSGMSVQIDGTAQNTQSGVIFVGTPTGNGTMDFSISTGDDTALLALLEDI